MNGERTVRSCTFMVHATLDEEASFDEVLRQALRQFLEFHPIATRTGGFVASNGAVVEFLAPGWDTGMELSPCGGPALIGKPYGATTQEVTRDMEFIDRDPGTCDLPPPGWYCTRGRGHDGPCAAVQTGRPSPRPTT